MDIPYISRILSVTDRQVLHYIHDNHLPAEKVEGKWKISKNDFDIFMNSYWDKRHDNKGLKSVNENHIYTLLKFVEDFKNSKMPFNIFNTKYHNIESLIPSLKSFVMAKRDKSILLDKKSMTYAELSNKYNLSTRGLEDIVKKNLEKNLIREEMAD